MRRLLTILGVAIALMLLCVLSTPAQAQSTIPRDAVRHQLTLKREARLVWGLNAPVPAFAAQLHQESLWRADARSPVGAVGMAQFMPATAQWIGSAYGNLGAIDPFNPTWSIRALVTYDKHLYDRIKADDDCQRLAFALSAYNGGLGWVYKRQRLSSDAGVCFAKTCAINPGITAANQRENEAYPRRILLVHQPLYRLWGPGVCT